MLMFFFLPWKTQGLFTIHECPLWISIRSTNSYPSHFVHEHMIQTTLCLVIVILDVTKDVIKVYIHNSHSSSRFLNWPRWAYEFLIKSELTMLREEVHQILEACSINKF